MPDNVDEVVYSRQRRHQNKENENISISETTS